MSERIGSSGVRIKFTCERLGQLAGSAAAHRALAGALASMERLGWCPALDDAAARNDACEPGGSTNR